MACKRIPPSQALPQDPCQSAGAAGRPLGIPHPIPVVLISRRGEASWDSDTGYPPTVTNTKVEGEEEGDLGKLKLRGREGGQRSLENGSSKML